MPTPDSMWTASSVHSKVKDLQEDRSTLSNRGRRDRPKRELEAHEALSELFSKRKSNGV